MPIDNSSFRLRMPESSVQGWRVPKLRLGNEQNCHGIHKSRRAKNAVIPAWMPESSATDGYLPLAQVLDLGNVPARSFTSL